MGNIGRVICVALPFMLSVASIIALLVAALAGVTDKSLYVFKLNTTDLSISASDISSLLSTRAVLDTASPIEARQWDLLASATDAISSAGDSASDAASAVSSAAASAASDASDAVSDASDALDSTNITASDLGLADAYYISLWNYCQEGSNGTKTCTKASFNWASNTTDSFENKVESVASSLGYNVTLPDDVTSSLSAFGTVTRWTEIVFIIAFVALALEILVGIFSSCSRMVSCCTWIVSTIATIAVGAAAGLSTAMASVVVGAVKGTASEYGVNASFNTRFLATVWIAFAFALGACLFWIFTICCCAPERRAVGRRGGAGYTKHLDDDASMTGATGAYAPVGGNHYGSHNNAAAYSGNGYGHHNDTSYQGHGAAAGYYNNDKGFEPMRHQQV